MGYKVGFIGIYDEREDSEKYGRFSLDRECTKWVGSEKISEYGNGSQIVLVDSEDEARTFADVSIARLYAVRYGGWQNHRTLLFPIVYSD